MTYSRTKYWNQRMSDETKHGQEGFEQQDLTAQGVFAFLISLAVGGVLVYFVMKPLFYYFGRVRQRSHQPQQSPLVQQVEADTRIVSPDEITKFPQPRLERNERVEIRDFRLKEEQTLNSYGWVDEKAGAVRIPIEPERCSSSHSVDCRLYRKAGTVPPSAVSVANQAPPAFRIQAANRPGTKSKVSPRLMRKSAKQYEVF